MDKRTIAFSSALCRRIVGLAIVQREIGDAESVRARRLSSVNVGVKVTHKMKVG